MNVFHSFKSGIRQGAITSPKMFNLYIRDLVYKLRDKGCYICNQFAGCILFADDILLLSGSVIQLEKMLDICYDYGINMDISFNANKFHLIHVGQDYKNELPLLRLGETLLSWVNEFKYLGCVIRTGVKLQVAVDINCRKFLSASYAILQKCAGLSEEILCQIINTRCLPILLYGLESFQLSFVQKRRIKVAYNNIVRRIFNLGRFVSVRNVIAFIGAKPADIAADERRLLLVHECWFSLSSLLHDCAYITVNSNVFTNLSFVYDVHVNMSRNKIKLMVLQLQTRSLEV